jgi:hypothetical protein
MYRYQQMTQGQIGQIFGVSSHQIGRWLQEIKLRTEEGRPSREAHEGGYCETAPSRGQGYYWAWNPAKTVPALEKAGHERVFPPPLDLVKPPPLNGPFSLRQSGDGTTQIVNRDGSVTIFVLGGENAVLVCNLLNTGHRLGRIGTAVPANNNG